MIRKLAMGAVIALPLLAAGAGSAGAVSGSRLATERTGFDAASFQIEQVQFRRGPGPRFYGPRGYAGRPYWFARPWVRRPYFGTVVAGVALGTLITAAVAGYAPPRPAPNLCWYWADPSATRGYWDYCR